MNWMQTSSCAAAALLALALPARSQTRSSGEPLDSYEAMVAWTMNQGNQDEIAMGKLAKERAADKSVKDFADRIVRDHQSADTQVQSYARTHKIDLGELSRRLADMSQEQVIHERRARAVGSATGEWAWTWEHAARASSAGRTEMGKLRALMGVDFDRDFVRAMVSDHQMMIDTLKDARTRTTDSDLKGLIDKLLPTLEEHLSLAQKVQTRVSKA